MKNAPKRKPRGKKIKPREELPKNSHNQREEASREPRLIGYMRVSTEKQDHSLQHDALREAGVADADIFSDTISGSKVSRQGRDACLKSLVPGDTLIVWKIDRFSRSLKDLLINLEALEKRGIGFRSLTQAIDTTTPAGRMMMQIVGAFGEFEREIIRERVKAGIKAKRDAGRKRWGKAPAVDYDEENIIALLRNKMSQREIAKLTGVSKSTIQRIAQKV